MKIGIDARMYSQSGIGRYIRNLVSNLQDLDEENEYFILLQNEEYESLNFNKNFQKVKTSSRWYSIAEQIEIPKILNKLNLDLVHFPHFNVPLFYRGKFIVTIHDLIHQNFQMKRATTHSPTIYKLKQLGYKTIFKNGIKKSQKIITPSNFVKGELINKWKVSKDKITVTHEAVDEGLIDTFKKISEKEERNILDKFSIKPPFIFYVGNAHPHKNIENLIKAFLILRNKYKYLKLVLSGNNHYFWERLKSQYNQKDIIYTGYIDEKELVALYKNAQCFVMPSLEEGFGIPILEAMACECPVVTSNVASLPEVGGESCVYFDPKEVNDMVDKITLVLNNTSLRKKLITEGKKRSEEFSWKELASETLKIYKEF